MPLWLDGGEDKAFSVIVLDFSSAAVEFRGERVGCLGFFKCL